MTRAKTPDRPSELCRAAIAGKRTHESESEVDQDQVMQVNVTYLHITGQTLWVLAFLTVIFRGIENITGDAGTHPVFKWAPPKFD